MSTRRPLPEALQRANQQVTERIASMQSGETPPASPAVPEPAPAPAVAPTQPQPPAPVAAVQPVAPAPAPDVAKLQNDLNAALGKLQHEQQRVRDLEGINLGLVEQINQLRAESASLAARPAPAAPAPAPAPAPTAAFKFSDNVRDQLGTDLASAMEAEFNGFASNLVAPLHQKVEQVQRDEFSEFLNDVTRHIPNVAAINSMPAFVAWCGIADADGITNQQRFDRAVQTRNVERVVELYRLGLSAIGLAPPTAAAPAAAPVHAEPAITPSTRAPLDQRVVPAAAAATPAPSAPPESMVKLSDIRKLNERLTREAQMLPPARRMELKAQLDAMLAVQAKRPDLVIRD